MVYEYRVVEVLRVIDGDTVDVRIDLGFGLTSAIRMRVAGVDTPELYGPGAEVERGREALEFTGSWVRGRRLVVRTFKGAQAAVGIGDGAFGRWLGEFRDLDSGDTLTAAIRGEGLG